MDTSTKPSETLREGALVAAHIAVQQAARNAAKPGQRTTEFWTSILLPAAAAGGTVALKLLGGAAVVSMPWLAVPLAIAGAGLASFGYSMARGQVKSAALDAAGAAMLGAAQTALADPPLVPQ